MKLLLLCSPGKPDFGYTIVCIFYHKYLTIYAIIVFRAVKLTVKIKTGLNQ